MKARGTLVACAVAALALAVYSRTAGCGFLDFDDAPLLTANAHVSGGLSAAGARWAFAAPFRGNWIPVTWLSHMLDFTLWGAQPAPHHLVNAGLHAANAVLLFLVLAAYTGFLWRSAAVAALFAVHPLRVESVAWVSERKDLLMGLFALLALLAWRRFLERRTPARFLAALALFALGLLAKPLLVTLPVLLLVADLWPLGRWRTGGLLAEKIPFLALSLAAGVVALLAQAAAGATSSLGQLPIFYRGANAVGSVLWYLAKTAWPSGLGAFYPHPWRDQSPAAAALGLAAVAGITVLAVRWWKERPWLGFGWAWYLVALAPALGLVQAGTQARADRYAYLPQVGVLVAAVWAAASLAQRSRRVRLALPAAFAAAVLACSLVTWRQIGFWRDDATLFRRALAVTSRNYVAHTNLGTDALRHGRLAEAERELRAALAIAPDEPKIHLDLGVTLTYLGRKEEAASEYGEAIRLGGGARAGGHAPRQATSSPARCSGSAGGR